MGLTAQAVTTYLVLVLAGRSLGPAGFASLSSLYFLLTSTATGLFTPLEQEVTARRGGERARATWDDSLRRRAMGHGLAAAALAVGIGLALWPVTLQRPRRPGLAARSLCLALPGYACWFASRGELAGQGRLGVYGVELVVDGVVRLVGAVALVLTDHATSAGFGLLFGLSPWLAFAVAPRAGHATPEDRRAQRTPPLTGPLALLVLSALAAQLLINAGPLVVSLMASEDDRDRAGVYLAVLVVVRVPVYLFTAVQPGFLRALAEHAGGGRRVEFGHLLTLVVSAVSGVVLVACVLGTALAPPVVSWLFDFDRGCPASRVCCSPWPSGCSWWRPSSPRPSSHSATTCGSRPAGCWAWSASAVGTFFGGRGDHARDRGAPHRGCRGHRGTRRIALPGALGVVDEGHRGSCDGAVMTRSLR